MKLFLEMKNFDAGGRLLVSMVKGIKIIERLMKLMNEGFKELKTIRD